MKIIVRCYTKKKQKIFKRPSFEHQDSVNSICNLSDIAQLDKNGSKVNSWLFKKSKSFKPGI